MKSQILQKDVTWKIKSFHHYQYHTPLEAMVANNFSIFSDILYLINYNFTLEI